MAEAVPLFRAQKRRKLVKASNDEETSSNEEAETSNLVRVRQHNKNRGGHGIQFSSATRSTTVNDDDAKAVAQFDPTSEKIRDMASRFVGNTGQVVDINKHMMAYIESQMAKRQEQHDLPTKFTPSVSKSNTTNTTETTSLPQSANGGTTSNGIEQVNSAAQRKPGTIQIAEVDLGQSVHELNLARTKAAQQRLESGLPLAAEEEIKPPRRRKPRLGRDGKPFRPRPRKRRDSSEIARDALVEQMLHEHRLDIYDDTKTASGGSIQGSKQHDLGAATSNLERGVAGDDRVDQQTDEKLAEQFQQEFMDAVAERKVRNKAGASGQSKGAGVGAGAGAAADKGSSGPRLGGSRSARAKMAALQKQQQTQPGQQKK